MSRHNKVNKDRYVQRGRLTPDDMARERMQQGTLTGRAKHKENMISKATEPRGERASSRPRSEPAESE
jgi:hypothetical protein